MFHLLLSVIYLAFISLGLPDALLGSAWPSMYPAFHVPVSYAGIISMIIAAGTVISSLQSDRLTKKLGTGKITAISVATTAVALFGFSVSHSFIALCLWAVPYGLGGGSVDAALNNYVALHYESRHMSWLHCMWGVGASIGPYIMGYALSNKQEWSMGYRYISIFQIGLTAILIISLPLWKQFHKKEHVGQSASGSGNTLPVLTLKQIFQIPGAREILFRTKKDGMADEKTAERKLKWDEENRLLASDDNGFVTNYWYDADGERTVKTSGESDQVYVNSEFAGGRTNTAKFSLYVSPYLVANRR